MTREQLIRDLRGFKRKIRPLAEYDEYLRGLHNGLAMALAVCKDDDFDPVLAPHLFDDRPDDVAVETMEKLDTAGIIAEARALINGEVEP